MSQILLGFVLASPMLIGWHPQPTMGLLPELLAVAICSGVLVLPLSRARPMGSAVLGVSPGVLLLGLLIGVTLCQPIVIDFAYVGFWFGPLVVLFLALLVATAWLQKDNPRTWMDVVAVAVFVAALTNCVVGVLQYWQAEKILGVWQGRLFFWDVSDPVAHGNVAQRNILATLSVMGMAAAWHLFVGRRRLVLWCSLAFLSYVAAITHSRTPLLFVLVVLLLFLFSLVYRKAWAARGLAVVAGVVLLFQVVAPAVNSTVGKLAGVQVADQNALMRMQTGEGIRLRLTYWRYAVELGADAPVVGVGWKNFGPSMVEKGSVVGGWGIDELPTHAHNIIFHFAAELGWLAALATLLLLGLRVLSRSILEPDAAFSATALLVMAVHSQVEYPLWHPWLLFAFVIFFVDLERRDGFVRLVPVSLPRCAAVMRWVMGGGASLALIGALVSIVQLLSLVEDWTDYEKGRGRRESLFAIRNPIVEPYATWVAANAPGAPIEQRIRYLEATGRWLPYAEILRLLRDAYLQVGRYRDAERTNEVLRSVYGLPDR